jgi:hypothetical protein
LYTGNQRFLCLQVPFVSPPYRTSNFHTLISISYSIRRRLHRQTQCTSIGCPSIAATQYQPKAMSEELQIETYSLVDVIPDTICDCVVCPALCISPLIPSLNLGSGVHTSQIRTQTRRQRRGRRNSFGRGSYSVTPISHTSTAQTFHRMLEPFGRGRNNGETCL